MLVGEGHKRKMKGNIRRASDAGKAMRGEVAAMASVAAIQASVTADTLASGTRDLQKMASREVAKKATMINSMLKGKNQARAYEYSMTSPFRTCFSWHGTFFPLVLWRAELWVVTLAHTALLLIIMDGPVHRFVYAHAPEMIDALMEAMEKLIVTSQAVLDLATALTSFFLIFFSTQCYTR